MIAWFGFLTEVPMYVGWVSRGFIVSMLVGFFALWPGQSRGETCNSTYPCPYSSPGFTKSYCAYNNEAPETCQECGESPCMSDAECTNINGSRCNRCVAGFCSPSAYVTCSGAAASVTSLWPPNHALSSITVSGSGLSNITLIRVAQDEATNGTGDGDTAPDACGASESTVKVRSERAGGSNGRVYHIFFKATQNSQECEADVTVGISHNKGTPPVDDGPRFLSHPGKASAACP